MAWLLLVIAGLLEVGWAIGLKLSAGFTRLVPSTFTIVSIVASLWLLGVAAKSLPIGTAYGVWVGIGAIGTAAAGVLLLGEPTSPARLFFLGLLVVALVGLRVTA